MVVRERVVRAYVRGWRSIVSIYIRSMDTVKTIYDKIAHIIGIPKESYMWINRPPSNRKNNIKLIDENKTLFEYGIVNDDIITVVSPIAIMINDIEVAKINMDTQDYVRDLEYNLHLLGVVDQNYYYSLRSDNAKKCLKYYLLRDMFDEFNRFDLKIYVEYKK